MPRFRAYSIFSFPLPSDLSLYLGACSLKPCTYSAAIAQVIRNLSKFREAIFMVCVYVHIIYIIYTIGIASTFISGNGSVIVGIMIVFS